MANSFEEREHARWSRIFSGSNFYYGFEPGSVARRAVKYARSLHPSGGRALDAGCGEGQDLAFLAESGFDALGLDFAQSGLVKARRLLDEQGVQARLEVANLRDWRSHERFDLLLAVNCLQFLGEDAPMALKTLQEHVAPGGVLGFSAFARENLNDEPFDGSIYRFHLDEILLNFAGWQPFEAARLWQWSHGGGGPQPFVTLVAGKLEP